MERSADLIIVGGGILGVSHAYHALRAGLSVILLERDNRPSGATVRNFGQVVPSGMDTTWRQIGRQSLRFYKEIQREVDITVRQEGTLYIANDNTEIQLIHELYDRIQTEDYTCHLLSQNQCLERLPSLRKDYVQEGLFFPEEVVLDPRIAIHRLIDYCVKKYGLMYFNNTIALSVQSLLTGTVVEDNRRNTYKADQVIICSGNETKQLFPEIYEQSDLTLVKLQMLSTLPQLTKMIEGSLLTGWTIRRYESFRECPSYSAVLYESDPDVFYKKNGIHILFKQSLDGSIIIGDSHTYFSVDDKLDVDFDIEEDVNNFMLEKAKEIINLNNWSIQKKWIGVYTQCKTRDVFFHQVSDDITIVTGIGGKGMTAALGYSYQNIQTLFHLKSNA